MRVKYTDRYSLGDDLEETVENLISTYGFTMAVAGHDDEEEVEITLVGSDGTLPILEMDEEVYECLVMAGCTFEVLDD